MSIKSFWVAGSAATVLVLGMTSVASAQDTGVAGLAAVATEALGQSIGDASHAGATVFVTAAGKAKLPAPLSGSYFVNVEGKAASAVDAAKLREQRMSDAHRIAGQFGVVMEVGDSAFRREVDTAAQTAENRRQQAELQAQLRAHPGEPLPPQAPHEPPKVFIARTGVRFRAPDASRLPAFLDALAAAGIDIGGSGLTSQMPNLFTATQEVLGFGAVEKIDDAVWDQASQAAIMAARRQAEVLSTAAGRKIGEVRQIMLLSRSVSGGEATVTVAVRFAYAP